jgi:acetyl esterase/lipase
MLDHITIPQLRYLFPSTSAQYSAECRRLGLEPNSIEVNVQDRKVAAHWIGSPDAEMVILYFHGGGYVQPANEGNFKHLARLVKDMGSEKACRPIAALMLAYSLAPEAVYPTQLREAAATLSHLVHETGRSPRNIFVSGDSAGGNLAISLLSHLLHPHPDVPAIKLDNSLGGALLLSPWAGFDTTYPSFDNLKLDVLPPRLLRKWSAMFLNKANPTDREADPGPVSGDAWTDACTNPASWWTGLHNVVSDIFVCYGSYEVLADPIKEWEKKLRRGWAESGGKTDRLVFLETAKESHVQPVIDIVSPSAGTKSETQNAIDAWCKARLQR